ncbi:hypothetical protein M2138_000763 [Dysgonomonadaceae bacterium PH5-43]|nr:hypothetical protein [Dysgonomonadaceae bacterium PH5-43]
MNKKRLFEKRKQHTLRSLVLLAICCLALISTNEVKADVALYVNAARSGTGANAGTSWATAYKSLAEAVEIAHTTRKDVTHILVAKGTYMPGDTHHYFGIIPGVPGNIDGAGLVSVKYFADQLYANPSTYVASSDTANVIKTVLPSFYFRRDLVVLGGYASNVSDHSTDAATNAKYFIKNYTRDISEGATILKGKPAVKVGNAGYAGTLHVVLIANVSDKFQLDGFTIKESSGNSLGNSTASRRLYINGIKSTVKGNLRVISHLCGGGIYNHNAKLHIKNTYITDNTVSGAGAGIYNTEESSITLTNVHINRNTSNGNGKTENGNGADSGSNGSGMCNYRGSSATLNHVYFSENTGTYVIKLDITQEHNLNEMEILEISKPSSSVFNYVTIENNNGSAIYVGAKNSLTINDTECKIQNNFDGISNAGGIVKATGLEITNHETAVNNSEGQYLVDVAGTSTYTYIDGDMTLTNVKIKKFTTLGVHNYSTNGNPSSKTGWLKMKDVSITEGRINRTSSTASTIYGLGLQNSGGKAELIGGYISNNTILTNYSNMIKIFGVGVCNRNAGSLTMTNVTISNNTGSAVNSSKSATYALGGGLCNIDENTKLNLINVAIIDNAISINNTFTGTDTPGYFWALGGGFYNNAYGEPATLTLTNVTIAGNTVQGSLSRPDDTTNKKPKEYRFLVDGAGFCNHSNLGVSGGQTAIIPTVNNSLITLNKNLRNTTTPHSNVSAFQGIGNVTTSGSSGITPTTVNYKYTLVGEATLVANNIIANSSNKIMFKDADNGDYDLIYNSNKNTYPAVNTGLNSLNSTTSDLNYKNRVWDRTIDLGAYEAVGKFKWKGNGNPNNPSIKNLWSIDENWVYIDNDNLTPGVAPTPADTDIEVEYHDEAIDLHVDNIFNSVKYIQPGESKNAGLVVLPGAAITVAQWDKDYNVTTKDGKVTIKTNDYNSSEDKPNGALIVPNGTELYANVEFKHKAASADTVTKINTMTWQYFGIPVKGNETNDEYSAGNFEGFYVRQYKEAMWDATYWWKMLGYYDKMRYDRGYEIGVKDKNKKVLTFSGKLITNDVTITNLTYTPNKAYTGQHVITNPFTAALNINEIKHTQMDGSVYLFHTGSNVLWKEAELDGVTGAGAGQYISVPIAKAGTGGIPGTIASMQGFVMKRGTTTGANGTVTLKYPDVAKNTFMRSHVETPETVYTSIILSNNDTIRDRIWLFTDKEATHGYDIGHDGYKMFGAAKLAQFYVKELDGSDYQVNTVPNIDSTAIWFKAEEGISEYTLKFKHENIDDVYENIYLLDLQTGITTDITAEGSTYSFTATNETEAEKRFVISVKKDLTGLLEINQSGSDMFLQNNHATDGIITVHNLWGQKIMTRTFPAFSSTTLSEDDLPKGVYILSIEVEDEKLSKKVIIK